MSKVLFIGGINAGNQPRGGQEFRNQVILDYLQHQFPLEFIDTVGWRSNPKIIFYIVMKLWFKKYSCILISLTTLSAYRLLKFIHYFTRLDGFVIYSVIGGGVVKFIKENENRKKIYCNIHSVIVQGRGLQDSLNRLGLNAKVHFIPNFKRVKSNWVGFLPANERKRRFVFLSSIMEEKGVQIIFEAVEILKMKKLNESFEVHFYGPYENNMENYFLNQIKALNLSLEYRGILNLKSDPETAYEILRGYDCMLFPSYYPNEGFPGVFLDAFIAGLPVIASDWNMNAEVIVSDKNGIIVPAKDSNALATAMEYMISHPEVVNQMKKQCNDSAQYYDSDRHLAKLTALIKNVSF